MTEPKIKQAALAAWIAEQFINKKELCKLNPNGVAFETIFMFEVS